MPDIDRGRADMSPAVLPGSQAKIHVLEIAAIEILGEETDLVETRACHIKAKADPAP